MKNVLELDENGDATGEVTKYTEVRNTIVDTFNYQFSKNSGETCLNEAIRQDSILYPP